MLVPAMPRSSCITESAIGLLVDRFYAEIRRHPALAPVFQTAITAEEWPAHLATMRRFWSSVMLASGAYSGNPVAVHRTVRGMERTLFAQWLALFEATATTLFTPEPAAVLVAKAARIATSLELAVFHRLGAPPDGLRLPTIPTVPPPELVAPLGALPAAMPCD